jgi:hypothetical protein
VAGEGVMLCVCRTTGRKATGPVSPG